MLRARKMDRMWVDWMRSVGQLRKSVCNVGTLDEVWESWIECGMLDAM